MSLVADRILELGCRAVVDNCRTALAAPAPHSGLHPLTEAHAHNFETLQASVTAAQLVLDAEPA